MKSNASVLLSVCLLACSIGFAQETSMTTEATDAAPCASGIYRQDASRFLGLTRGDKGFNVTFSDGSVGNTLDADAVVSCAKDAVLVRGEGRWRRVAIIETNTQFASNGVLLAGRLMAPPDAGKNTPLVVYAHGSEGSGWIDRARDPYQMVGRGVAVFVYDKRGTGLSKGVYTQNLPLLADDLVAASSEARRLAAGRFGRFGLFGLSQGGWVVPLAAARAKAEFIGIGYGLLVDIAEQDAAQVTRELRAHGYGDDIVAIGRMATDITATIARSHYREGLERLSAFQAQYGKAPWFAHIKGTFTGVVLGTSTDTLRSNGMPAFDKLDVDWSLQPVHILSGVRAPQLWALAGEDRQAPIAITIERLNVLRKQGRDISVFVFPQAGHGMWEYAEATDGTRKNTRITTGFYELMADWAKGGLRQRYGHATRADSNAGQ